MKLLLFNHSTRTLLLGIIISVTSCKKFVDVEAPITTTNSSIIYEEDATAIATLNNIYVAMSQQSTNNGLTSMSLYAGLSADELVVFNGADDQTLLAYYDNALTAANTAGSDFWITVYTSVIFPTNAAIEGLSNSHNLTPKVKNQLLGEAKFLRAFCYFYLVNLYGDVPLALTVDHKVNSTLKRSSTAEVYDQIVTDLQEAQNLLINDYLSGTILSSSDDRIVPNRDAATALLARVYLYRKDWKNAETESSKVIENSAMYEMESLEDAFAINNRESIWQLQSVSSVITNTGEGYLFILPPDGPNNYQNKVYLSSSLVESFEADDKRRNSWINSVTVDGITYYYSYKYKVFEASAPVVERSVVLRLAEQYLIRAEARAQLGNVEGALADVNEIRNRAGLNDFTNQSKDEVLVQIEKERRAEFFTEWGHRWLDLKRYGIADNVLLQLKSNWQSTDQLYPIPQAEITKNINLAGAQNPGY